MKYVEPTSRYDWIMEAAELLGTGVVLLGTVCVGLVAHEFAHAAVLRCLGIPFDVDWLPTSTSRLDGRTHSALAAVTPTRIPVETPTWGIQLSAVAPLVLATPFLLIVFGIVPDPLAMANPYLAGMTVAWLACSLPSPQDFSVFWHADSLQSGRKATPTAGD